MRRRWMHLIAGVTVFVLCISTCTTTVDAALVWSDDFESGLGEWTIYGWSNTTSSYVIIEGNFSTESGMLTALDDDINIARHNSTVNVGTWSFDMFVPDNGTAVYVDFMTNGSRPVIDFPSRYLTIGVYGGWNEFIVMEVYGYSWAILSHIDVEDIPADSLSGWHHIDVSRTSDRHLYVYFNETLVDDFVGISVENSTYLEFYCFNATGAAIDNLVVDDEPMIHTTTTTTTTTTTATSTSPTTTPTTPPPLPWDLIAIGGGVAVLVIVLVVVFSRRR